MKEVRIVWDKRNNRASMGSRCEEMMFFPTIGSTRDENEKRKEKWNSGVALLAGRHDGVES